MDGITTSCPDWSTLLVRWMAWRLLNTNIPSTAKGSAPFFVLPPILHFLTLPPIPILSPPLPSFARYPQGFKVGCTNA